MRTKQMYNDVFQLDTAGTRDAPGFGSFSVLLPPGRYTVKLTVDGQSQSQPLEVRKDPNAFATDQDIKASVDRLLALQVDQNAAADMVNTIEIVRAQLQQLRTRLATDRSNSALVTRGDSLEQRFISVEQNLVDLRQTGRGQDGVRWPTRAGGQISYLAGNIGGSSLSPTTQQVAVHGVLQKQVKDTRTALDALIQKELAAFNQLLSSKGQPPIGLELPKPIP